MIIVKMAGRAFLDKRSKLECSSLTQLFFYSLANVHVSIQLNMIRVELVGSFCSPYSTTILLPNLQQGKPTVKADIIFEEHS